MDTMEIVALLDSDPAAGVLAVADLLDEEIKRIAWGLGAFQGATAEDHDRLVWWLRAAVRRWRGVVDRHKPYGSVIGRVVCAQCRTGNLVTESPSGLWPCPDLTETADEARAYLTGEAGHVDPA